MILNNPATPWYTTAYRRAVIDMHIPDWDDAFLSRLDAGQYVAMLVKARAQSIVAYAMSHVGLFNYPTKVGRQHKNLKGRDIVREIIDGCLRRGIAVVLYNSLIFDRTSADLHPEWRMRAVDGSPHGAGGRHGLVCPNTPYREYVRAWVEEECRLFDPEGFRFDMTFWPAVCYCDACKKRFADEVGGAIPTTVNWLDEQWVAFQHRREAWLAEFAAIATGTVRTLRPGASVEHQSSTFPLHWQFGVNAPLIPQNDFLQGDFYGDSWQGSFVRKLLEDLTPHRPFGFETSFSAELADHTAMKPEALLEAKASAAVADNAAFIFIDAIDPIGTLNPKVYDRMGRIFDRLMPYYAELGGKRVADVAVYYSLDSKFDFAGNGRPVARCRHDRRPYEERHLRHPRTGEPPHPLRIHHQDDPEPSERAQSADPARRQHDGRRRDRGDPRVGAHGAASCWPPAGRRIVDMPRPAPQGLRPGRCVRGHRSSRRAGRPGRTTSRRGGRWIRLSAISAPPIRPLPGRPDRRC